MDRIELLINKQNGKILTPVKCSAHSIFGKVWNVLTSDAKTLLVFVAPSVKSSQMYYKEHIL